MGALLLVGASAAEAPGSEDPLPVLIRQALEANPGLRAKRKEVQAAELGPQQAQALPDPEADAEFMMISATHPSLKDALSQGISLGVTQVLPAPGKRGLREEKARREVALAEAELAALQSDMAGDVAAAAYQYALARRELALNEEKGTLLRSAAEGALARYSSGGGSQADVLTAQSAVTENDLDRTRLTEQKAIAGARLASLIAGDPPGALLDRIALPEVAQTPALDPLVRELQERAPWLQAARARKALRDAEADLARSDFKPDFEVGARYRYKDPTMGGEDFITLSVGMTLPFFNRKRRYQPALQQALVLAEASRYESDDTFNRLRFEMMEAVQKAERDRAAFALQSGALLPQARLAFEASLAAYGSGKADFRAVLDALSSWYGFESQTAESQAGYGTALAGIGALLGKPLDPALSAPATPASTTPVGTGP